jgi:hypothetical protein
MSMSNAPLFITTQENEDPQESSLTLGTSEANKKGLTDRLQSLILSARWVSTSNSIITCITRSSFATRMDSEVRRNCHSYKNTSVPHSVLTSSDSSGALSICKKLCLPSGLLK